MAFLSASGLAAAGAGATAGVMLVLPNSGGRRTASVAVLLPTPRGVWGSMSPLGAHSVPNGTIPAANRTQLVRCASGPLPSSFAEGQDRAVPKGASLGWGVLPTANRRTSVALCSSGPPPSTFGEIMCQEFGLHVSEISTKINCVALVGQQDVLDEIADSAQGIVAVVCQFTPQLVDMIYDRFIREALPPQGLVGFFKSKALNVITALEIVRAECKEGYVRDDSLVKAISMVREAARRVLPKTYILPPPYAASVPKADKLAYCTALATELDEISAVLHKAMVEMLTKT